MIAHASPLFKPLHLFANALNPLFALVLIGVLIVATRKKEIDARAWIAAIAGIGVVYLFHRLDQKHHWWRSFGSDYSTHSAICAAFLIPLAFLRPRLAPLLLVAFFAYAALMIALGFHTLFHVWTTLLVVAPILLILNFALNKKTPVETASIETA